jgi:hypothetical protein
MRVAVLASHAQCATHVSRQPSDSKTAAAVREAQAPFAEQLNNLWLELLQDHAVLRSQSLETLGLYAPLLFGSTSPPVVGAVRPYLEVAWPTVLEGLTASLSSLADVKGPAGTASRGGLTRPDRLLWASFFGLQQAMELVGPSLDTAGSLKSCLQCLRR